MEPTSFDATVTFNRANRLFAGISGFAIPPCLYELAVVIVAVPALLVLTPWALTPFLLLPLATGYYTIRNAMKLRKQEQCRVELKRGYFFITIPGRFVLTVKPKKLTIIGLGTVRISGRFTSITLRTNAYLLRKIREQFVLTEK